MIDTREVLAGGDALARWEMAARLRTDPGAFYGTPAWASFIADTTDSAQKLVLAADASGGVAGAVPMFLRRYPLRFSVGDRVLVRKHLHAAEILGSTPSLPDDAAIHRDAIASAFARLPGLDALYLDAVPTDGFFFRSLLDGTALPPGCRLHIVDGPRPWHLARVAPSFEEYLTTLSSKPGARLRRDVRQLGKALGGEARVRRVTDPADVASFLDQAVRVSRKSWQHRVLGERVSAEPRTRAAFERLASRGNLRGYLLHVGDTPCAFVIGYQYGGAYQYEEQAFDPAFAQHSPGAVLLFLVLQDLHAYERPEIVNFGVGDAGYKRRFGNCERSDASCLVLRGGLANTVLAQSHRLFTSGVAQVKKIVGRSVAM